MTKFNYLQRESHIYFIEFFIINFNCKRYILTYKFVILFYSVHVQIIIMIRNTLEYKFIFNTKLYYINLNSIYLFCIFRQSNCIQSIM